MRESKSNRDSRPRSGRRSRRKKYKVNKIRLITSLLIMVLVLWGSVKVVSGAVGFVTTALGGNRVQKQLEEISIDEESTETKTEKTESLPDEKSEEKTTSVSTEQKKDQTEEKTNPPAPAESKTATILATGDILYHFGMIDAGYNAQADSYDFRSHYDKVREMVAGADLALANFEGTMAQDLYPLAAYPLFNAPNAVATALADAGFDALCTANNHCLDSGTDGIAATIDAIEANGMGYFGTKKTPGNSLLVKDVNGIKIGLLAYSSYFNGLEENLSEEEGYVISPMDMETIESDIKNAKAEGCDLVVVYAHWGVEYEFAPTEDQRNMAHNMIEWGCDIVLGSHPHVLQETEIVEKDGRDRFIIYSMGNGISNQREETIGNKYTETGVLLRFTVRKTDDETILEQVEMYPTWVNSFLDEQGSRRFELLNTQDFVEGGSLRDTVPEHTLNRIIDARTYGLQILKGEFN